MKVQCFIIENNSFVSLQFLFPYNSLHFLNCMHPPQAHIQRAIVLLTNWLINFGFILAETPLAKVTWCVSKSQNMGEESLQTWHLNCSVEKWLLTASITHIIGQFVSCCWNHLLALPEKRQGRLWKISLWSVCGDLQHQVMGQERDRKKIISKT